MSFCAILNKNSFKNAFSWRILLLIYCFFSQPTLFSLVIFRLLSTCSSPELSYAFIYIRVYTFPCCSCILSSFSHLSALDCPSLGFFFSSFFWHLCQSFKSHPSRTIYLCSAWVFLFVRLSHESLHVQLSISSFTTPPVPCWQTPPYGHTRTHVLVAFQTGGLRSRAWVVLGRGTWNKWARDNEDLPIKQRTS